MNFKRQISLILILLFGVSAQAGVQFQDPTGGKPFLPWIWEDQFKPMVHHADNRGSLVILGGGVVTTVLAHQYDDDIQRAEELDPSISSDYSKYGAILGSGLPGISIAVAQLFFDQKNGLMHGRAIAMTSLTHITTALVVRRERPNHANRLSFPSGHTSSAFATAASLGFAYGPWVGLPAYLAAGFIAQSRMSDQAHWFSDNVAGAALGIYWASVSYAVEKDSPFVAIQPIPVPGGGMLSMNWDF